MEVKILNDYEQVSKAAALEVKHALNSKPDAVLGLATGSTPLGLYKELVRMHREEGLDFSQVTTFNLDEYVGLGREDEQSYHYFMHENLFRHINIPAQNIFIPSGTTDNYEAFCAGTNSGLLNPVALICKSWVSARTDTLRSTNQPVRLAPAHA